MLCMDHPGFIPEILFDKLLLQIRASFDQKDADLILEQYIKYLFQRIIFMVQDMFPDVGTFNGRVIGGGKVVDLFAIGIEYIVLITEPSIWIKDHPVWGSSRVLPDRQRWVICFYCPCPDHDRIGYSALTMRPYFSCRLAEPYLLALDA